MGASAIEIEGYHDVEPIGSGGVGVVYRATRSSTGRVVAIKVLRDLSDESVAWHRTRRELTALVALAGHANVIQLFEVFELLQGPALSMEYAPGGSIADLLDRRHGVVPIAETVLVGQQTAAALVAAHAQGIVHRDIKPHNLLIDAYGQIKLCDFGIASLTRTDGFRTRTGAWSMRYASPEDLDGEVEVGPASDVYSLGATLLHLAHGAPPSLKDRLAEWVPPISDDPHQTELDELLASCLQPRPGRRPSADELVDRLERLGWALDERCRALPVDGPDFVDRVGYSEAIVVGSRSGRVPDRVRPSLDTSAGDLDSAETVVRPGRRPPARPIGRPQPRRRWRAIVAAMTVLAVLGLAVLVWWPKGSGGSIEMASSVATEPDVSPPASVVTTRSVSAPHVEPAPTTITTSNEPVLSFGDRPDGLVAIDDASLVWPFGDVGECLIQTIGVAELQPVSCERPHDLQRIAVGELDTIEFPPGSGFDRATVQAAVEAACATAFESFVGPDGDLGVLDVPVTRPSAASWRQGDRHFQCLIGVAQRRISGDAGGAAGAVLANAVRSAGPARKTDQPP